MSNDKKANNKKPKLNPYWVYGSIIAVFLIFNIFSGGMSTSNGSQTDPDMFFQYLENGDIDELEIIRNTHVAKVYLTNEALSREVHKKSSKPSILSITGRTPNYTFKFGDLKNFEDRIDEIKEANELTTKITFDDETNVWGDFLLTLLPFVLIIGVWIFIMRRMSGGAGGGGAGGQLFNIGKSKAKLLIKIPKLRPHLKMLRA